MTVADRAERLGNLTPERIRFERDRPPVLPEDPLG